MERSVHHPNLQRLGLMVEVGSDIKGLKDLAKHSRQAQKVLRLLYASHRPAERSQAGAEAGKGPGSG